MPFHHRNSGTSFVKAIGESVDRQGYRPKVRIRNPRGHHRPFPRKVNEFLYRTPGKGGEKRPQTKTAVAVFDIFVDFRLRPGSGCNCLFSMDFYGLSPRDRDVSCRTFDPPGDGVQTESTEILSYFNVLQMSGTTGTGDAVPYIRKHMLTERGHDQPTVK